MRPRIKKSADPLPPVPASCRGDWRGMQLEVIGINDSPCKARPKAQKVDSQDRSGTWSWDRLLAVSKGPVAVLGDRSWGWSWGWSCAGQTFRTGPSRSQDRVLLVSAHLSSRHLFPPVSLFPDWHPCFRTGQGPKSVPVPPCDRLRGTDGLVSRTSST